MKKPIVIATLFDIVLVVAYIISFYGASLSDKTSDWGAFGSYVGMGISTFSVALIYITYNEQKQSNRISMFEQHIKVMFDTISLLVDRNKQSIEEDMVNISNHFQLPSYDLEKLERAKVLYVCSYYYTKIETDNNRKHENVFLYLTQIINYIKNEKSIMEEDVRARLIELTCILPKSVMNLYFFWLSSQSSNKEFLRFCYLHNLFIKEDPNDFLSALMCYVCTEKKLNAENIDYSDIDFGDDDYSREFFFDTYDRLCCIHKD